MTILETKVAEENWPALREAYADAIKQMEPGLVETFLVHGTRESDLWRIITLWRSRDALDEMRRSGNTPTGVLIFRSAQAEPALSVFDVDQTARMGQ